MHRIRRCAGLLAAAGTLIAGAAWGAPGPGEVGSQAADFSLEALDGTIHTLAGHRGEVVLLTIIGYG